MCGPPERLCQLEFVVKTVTRCGGGGRTEDDGCGTELAVQFADLPEQTVCEMRPAVTACGQPDDSGGATVVTVDSGKTFTFAAPAADDCQTAGCGSRPTVSVAVRLYRLLGADTLPDRVQLASGHVDVVPVATDCPDDACEQTVPLTDSCADGRTAAVLTVLTRAWDAGPVTAAAVQLPPRTPAACCPVDSPPPTPPPPPPPPTTPTPCCSREPVPPPSPDDCGRPSPPPPPPPPPSRTCPRRCNKCCCDAASATRRRTSSASTASETHRQFTNLCCEIDGRKIDLRVRKKNFETCAVQRQIACEAEAFASRVMNVVREMHGLISDSLSAKMSAAE